MSHKMSPNWHSGRVGFYVTITHEYADSPIWACSHYLRNCAVPIWLTQSWEDTTCNPPALNECNDTMSPKTPHEPVMFFYSCLSLISFKCRMMHGGFVLLTLDESFNNDYSMKCVFETFLWYIDIYTMISI